MKSPLPYGVNEDGIVIYSRCTEEAVAVCAPNPYSAAFPDDPAICRENAEFIARACNVHPYLVELAEQYGKECGECAGTGITPDDEDCDECRFIRDVLAKAAP